MIKKKAFFYGEETGCFDNVFPVTKKLILYSKIIIECVATYIAME